MSSLLSGRVLQFDFDAKRDEDDPRTSKVFRTEFRYYEADNMENGIAGFCTSLDADESHIGLELETSDIAVQSLLPYWYERSLSSSTYHGIELVDNQVGHALCVKETDLIVAENDLELAGEVRDGDKAAMRARLVDYDPDTKQLADIHFPVDCGNNVVDRKNKISDCTCNCSEVEERCSSSFQHQCTTSQDAGKEDGNHTAESDVLANLCEFSAQRHSSFSSFNTAMNAS